MKSFKFTIKGHDYEVEIKEFENNVAEVEVNGTVYEVELQREAPAVKTPVIKRQELPVSRTAHKFKKSISTHLPVKAPLPGNVMQVFVKDGDEVAKGDKLLMYEAMKMENVLTAEKDGKVENLRVNPGDSILQGDLLLEIV